MCNIMCMYIHVAPAVTGTPLCRTRSTHGRARHGAVHRALNFDAQNWAVLLNTQSLDSDYIPYKYTHTQAHTSQS